MSANSQNALWPFSSRAALLAAPVIWVMVALILAITRRVLVPPTPEAGGRVLLVGVGLGLIPLVLLLVDHLAASRGTLDIKGIKLDFSQAEIRRMDIELPENIGKPG